MACSAKRSTLSSPRSRRHSIVCYTLSPTSCPSQVSNSPITHQELHFTNLSPHLLHITASSSFTTNPLPPKSIPATIFKTLQSLLCPFSPHPKTWHSYFQVSPFKPTIPNNREMEEKNILYHNKTPSHTLYTSSTPPSILQSHKPDTSSNPRLLTLREGWWWMHRCSSPTTFPNWLEWPK